MKYQSEQKMKYQSEQKMKYQSEQMLADLIRAFLSSEYLFQRVVQRSCSFCTSGIGKFVFPFKELFPSFEVRPVDFHSSSSSS